MKICRMFVFIRVKQQFYYIAKQGFLLRNSKVDFTRHFKMAAMFSRWLPQYTLSINLAKIMDVLNFEAKHCFFILDSQFCEHLTHHYKW